MENIEYLSIEDILDLGDEPNLIPHLDEDLVQKEGLKAIQGFEEDDATMGDWRAKLEEINKIATQEQEEKNYPFPGASNVKYPLITEAVLQFNARAYPTIVNDGNIALAKVIGKDDGTKKRRANRASRYMSYQLTEQMDDWDAEMDRLLMAVPQMGLAFKKVYYSPILGRNVSEFVLPTDLVVNDATKDLKTCPRISHIICLYPHEVIEKINAGEFSEDIRGKIEEATEEQTFIEQHTLIDLDGDGYPEPYILTFHEETGCVCRIVADFGEEDINFAPNGDIISIRRNCYFAKYECFPSADGSFYTPGLGSLLLNHNEAINSILNQMIDAGHLANSNGGFVSREFRVRGGTMTFSPNEFKKTDVPAMALKDSIMLAPVREPSMALFQLLGILIDGGKSIASIQEVMTGGGGMNQPAATTLALIEQGMKVYSGIFKRIYRGLRDELRLLFKLNAKYLNEDNYVNVLDDEEASPDDFRETNMDITPAADPNMATDIQKRMKDQALLQLVSIPGANVPLIVQEYLSGLGFSEPKQYFPDPQPPQPSPDDMIKLIEAQVKKQSVEIDKQKADNDTRNSLTVAIERLQKVANEGGDLGSALAELGILEIFKQQTAQAVPQIGAINAQPIQNGQGLPGLEGGQPLALGLPEGPAGPIGGQ